MYMQMGYKCFLCFFSRWFLFEKVIEALLAKQIYHRNLKQLQHYAEKECFLRNAEEFAAMISFYHGRGMIIKHRSTVVLKRQWLIDLLKQLIAIPRFDKMVGKIFLVLHFTSAVQILELQQTGA